MPHVEWHCVRGRLPKRHVHNRHDPRKAQRLQRPAVFHKHVWVWHRSPVNTPADERKIGHEDRGAVDFVEYRIHYRRDTRHALGVAIYDQTFVPDRPFDLSVFGRSAMAKPKAFSTNCEPMVADMSDCHEKKTVWGIQFRRSGFAGPLYQAPGDLSTAPEPPPDCVHSAAHARWEEIELGDVPQ